MNTSRVRILLCCAAAIFANGCNPIDPCAGLCEPNEVCDGATNTCVECVSDADCNDQDACTTDTCAGDVCINAPISCNTADTCPDGCNVSCNAFFSCSNSIDPCVGGACDPNEVCINGVCVECGSDADCFAGEVCDEATNTCVECVRNDDCDDQNACTENICVGGQEGCLYDFFFCDSAEDCPAGCDAECSQFGFCTD